MVMLGADARGWSCLALGNCFLLVLHDGTEAMQCVEPYHGQRNDDSDCSAFGFR